jgi:hypothetical protein
MKDPAPANWHAQLTTCCSPTTHTQAANTLNQHLRPINTHKCSAAILLHKPHAQPHPDRTSTPFALSSVAVVSTYSGGATSFMRTGHSSLPSASAARIASRMRSTPSYAKQVSSTSARIFTGCGVMRRLMFFSSASCTCSCNRLLQTRSNRNHATLTAVQLMQLWNILICLGCCQVLHGQWQCTKFGPACL